MFFAPFTFCALQGIPMVRIPCEHTAGYVTDVTCRIRHSDFRSCQSPEMTSFMACSGRSIDATSCAPSTCVGGWHDAYPLHVKYQEEVSGLWIGPENSIFHATCITVSLGSLLFSRRTNCPRHLPTSLNLLSLVRHFSNLERGLMKCTVSLQRGILIYCGLFEPPYI